MCTYVCVVVCTCTRVLHSTVHLCCPFDLFCLADLQIGNIPKHQIIGPYNSQSPWTDSSSLHCSLASPLVMHSFPTYYNTPCVSSAVRCCCCVPLAPLLCAVGFLVLHHPILQAPLSGRQCEWLMSLHLNVTLVTCYLSRMSPLNYLSPLVASYHISHVQ